MNEVSIIIPAYNASKDIDACLSSIIKQTYKDIEIIVINDGSIDNTAEIVSAKAKEDSRIKLYDNPNKGVSSARNYGLDVATGKYIAFVDSDDIISQEFVQTLVYIMENNDCSCAAVSLTVHEIELESVVDKHGVMVYKDDTVFSMLSNAPGGYVCNKIFISSIIRENNIHFDNNICAGEDLLFNFRYLKHTDKSVFLDRKLYYYRLTSGSSINRLDNPKWFDLLKVYEYIFDSDISPNAKKVFQYNYSLVILEALYRLKYCKCNKYTAHELKVLRRKYVKLDVKYSVTQNIKLLFFILFPNISMKYKRRNIEVVL